MRKNVRSGLRRVVRGRGVGLAAAAVLTAVLVVLVVLGLAAVGTSGGPGLPGVASGLVEVVPAAPFPDSAATPNQGGPDPGLGGSGEVAGSGGGGADKVGGPGSGGAGKVGGSGDVGGPAIDGTGSATDPEMEMAGSVPGSEPTGSGEMSGSGADRPGRPVGPDGLGFVPGAARSSGEHGIRAAPEAAVPSGPQAGFAPSGPSAKVAPSGPSAKIVPPGPGPDPDRGTVSPDVAPDRAVIRNARLTVDVRDLPAASRLVRDTAASVGGFVAAERVVDRASNFTLRVPSDRLDEVVDRLAGTGTVTERFGQAEDVTDQMVDLQGRLATQRASVARVRALLERSNTVGEVVAVESELASREAELESLQRRLASMTGRVTLSTLTVALNPVPVVAAPEHDDGFLAGLVAGWRAFLSAAGGLLTALGVALPFALALAVLFGLGWLGRRAVRRHRAAEAALAAVAAGAAGSAAAAGNR